MVQKRKKIHKKIAGAIEALHPDRLEEHHEVLDTDLIDEVIAATGAENIRDMGKVMAAIKTKAGGRADMGVVGSKVKARLNV